jgi:hypothetical protein
MVSLVVVASPAGAAQLGRFGEPLRTWQATYARDTTGCEASDCYGPRVAKSSDNFKFSYVTSEKGRVDGFDIALQRGTSLARAELEVAELFPRDMQMGSVTVIHRDSEGNSCAVYNVNSKSIERIFGKRAFGNSDGSVGVELTKVLPNGNTVYNSGDIDLALVVPTYLGSDADC